MPPTLTSPAAEMDKWFRNAVVRSKPERIDRANGVIYGIAQMSKGLTNDSRGVVDDTTLSQILSYGQGKKQGVKARFGHPAMSSDAMGTFLGRKKDYRMSADGKSVLADLHFDKSAFSTPNGDLATYVMDQAESDPESFGASVVVKNGAHEYQNDEAGNPDKTKPMLLRFRDLMASDIVDSPAANPGLFDGTNVKFSAEMTEFLDKFFQRQDAVERVLKFVGRYAALNPENEDMPPTTATAPDRNAFLSELKKFTDAFGAANGLKWFNEALGFEAAQVEHAKVSQPTRAEFAAELKKFTDAFGAENGAKWFNEGKSFTDAQAEHITVLNSENGALKKRIKDANLGESTPLSTETELEKKAKKSVIRMRQ